MAGRFLNGRFLNGRPDCQGGGGGRAGGGAGVGGWVAEWGVDRHHKHQYGAFWFHACVDGGSCGCGRAAGKKSPTVRVWRVHADVPAAARLELGPRPSSPFHNRHRITLGRNAEANPALCASIFHRRGRPLARVFRLWAAGALMRF